MHITKVIFVRNGFLKGHPWYHAEGKKTNSTWRTDASQMESEKKAWWESHLHENIGHFCTNCKLPPFVRDAQNGQLGRLKQSGPLQILIIL